MEEWELQKVSTMALSTLIAHPALSAEQVSKLTQLCITVQQRVSPLPESPAAAYGFFFVCSVIKVVLLCLGNLHLLLLFTDI